MKSPHNARDPAELAMAGADATAEEAAALEALLQRNPDDFAARLNLLGYYSSRRREAPDKYAEHALWAVRAVPEANILPWIALTKDAPLYDEVKELWRAHLSDSTAVPFAAVWNAIFFLRTSEPEEAEAILQGPAGAKFGELPEHWEKCVLFYVGWVRSVVAAEERVRILTSAMSAVRRHVASATDRRFSHTLGLGARIAVELEQYEEAHQLAEQLLHLAAGDSMSWRRNNALHAAYTSRGLVRLRQAGDLEKTVEDLNASVAIEPSPQLKVGGVSFDLASDVIKRDAIEAGLHFLSQAERLWTFRAERLPIVRAALAAGDAAPFLELAAERAQLGPCAPRH
jgi:hypothetical protein